MEVRNFFVSACIVLCSKIQSRSPSYLGSSKLLLRRRIRLTARHWLQLLNHHKQTVAFAIRRVLNQENEYLYYRNIMCASDKSNC